MMQNESSLNKPESELLTDLLSQPKTDAVYYYNLGTVYYRLGKPGLAFAHLKKANQLRSHDSNIQFNLALAKKSLEETIGADRLDPGFNWVEQMGDHLTFNQTQGILGLLTLSIILLWIKKYQKTRNLRQTFVYLPTLLGLVAWSITLGLSAIELWSESHPAAVSLARQEIRSGPGNHYQELTQVEEGAQLRLLGPTATEPQQPAVLWNQVRYSSDGIGWIRATNLLVL